MYDISNRSIAGSPDDIGKILLPIFASLQSSLPLPVSSEEGLRRPLYFRGGVRGGSSSSSSKEPPPVPLKFLLNRRRLVRMELGSMVGSCATIKAPTDLPTWIRSSGILWARNTSRLSKTTS